jgi:Tfp pilus assembly protein PilV
MNIKGQSLFEVVVAIGVSALIIVAIVSLASNSIRNATFSRNDSQAASYAQQATEWLRAERDRDINIFMTNVSLNTPAPTTYCFSKLDWNQSTKCGASDFIKDANDTTDTIFLREAVFNIDKSTGKTIIQTDISVFWTDSQGVHTVTSATNFADWRQR